MDLTPSRRTSPWLIASLAGVSSLITAVAIGQPAPGKNAAPAVTVADLTAPLPTTLPTTGPVVVTNDHRPLPLGKRMESKTHGISFCPPARFTGVIEAGRDEAVRYVDDLKKQEWVVSLIKRTFTSEQQLFGKRIDGKRTERGIVENTLYSLVNDPEDDKKIVEFPNAKVLNAGDATNIGPYRVGKIVFRYTRNGERRLAQHAIIERNNQFFYLLSMNSPGRKDVAEDQNVEELTIDPIEKKAVETFQSILESVELMDLDAVRKDQVERLVRTRTLYRFLTERRLKEVIVPEQYLRVIRDGKDIGYSYVIEKFEKKGGGFGTERGVIDGIRVGVRTRMMTPDPATGKPMPFQREDSESFMFTAVDRAVEDWTRVTVWDDNQPKTTQKPWRKVTEVGTSSLQRTRVAAVRADDPNRTAKEGDNTDPRNPWVNFRETYNLTVQLRSTGSDLDTVKRELSPFYLPQALGAMIYRIVPADDAKTYMFASYVPELQQVAMRYVDVGKEESLPRELARLVVEDRAVPISDRLGYEGVATIHYVTKAGKYVGSITPTAKTVVVPSSEEGLKQIWDKKEIKELFELSTEAPGGADLMNRTREAQPLGSQPGQQPPPRNAPPGRPLPPPR